ncbi:uncharacterized protein LOC125879298 isoform X2 [Epinephelus fuscoguttatus]|uniref:uncharacterized protein LOC125879298 isoform X2 n=1 Tax=Epinephelus fuscoguttatus TaxID=293821 RepID=UPI0020CFFFB1|nr:uncharacterized protein LOC125879298 isoform X2 [Epinephelus fuscoguttatus]
MGPTAEQSRLTAAPQHGTPSWIPTLLKETFLGSGYVRGRSLSLDDRSGSMTAWKHAHLCLFVLLGLIDLSKEGCEDYFTMERMKKYLNHTVYLIETGELKDTLECTVERECIAGHEPYCLWLDHCYDRRDVPKTETEKCKGNPSVGISHYQFGCLVSHYTLSEPVEGCKNYERVCELHKERQPILSEETKPSQRPPPPPTTTKATLPETTTAAPTTLPDTTRATTTATTAAAPTTLPDTTRATTTTATTTATALSPTVTQSAVSGNNANNSKIVHEAGNDNTNTDPLKIFLGISVIFNVIAVLGGLYMRHRWTQDRKQWGNMLVLESKGYSTEAPLATEPRSETPPSSANREEENIHLMTPQDCQSIVTHSANRDSHCCAAGEEKHL